MATALEVLKRLERSIVESGGGENPGLELLPPLDEDEFRRLESQIPCPIPDEARQLFQYARGFRIKHARLHGAHRRRSPVDLSGLDGEFGLEQVFPHAVSVADDGCGNYWVVDLTQDSTSWGPIFYACHDPAVIVYQADDVAGFIKDVLGAGNELEAVQKAAGKIWHENPGVIASEECMNSSDEDLRTFARSLDASYQFIDLRKPMAGEGYSWGRYGPWTVNKRFGEKRIFGYQKKTNWERFKQFWKGRP